MAFLKFQFSFKRFLAVGKKEFMHMKRDKATYAMIVGIPLMQSVLFGLAVNATPKHLPVTFVVNESSAFSRRLITAMENSLFFSFNGIASSETDAEKQLKTFQTSYIVHIPDQFEKNVIRGNQPEILLEADATDPAAIAAGKNVFPMLVNNVVREIYGRGIVNKLVTSTSDLVDIRIHSVFNPSENSHYSVIPGILGVILTMSMSLITAQAITREKDNGTMETILSTPVRPVEVLLGKLLPYILIGYLQMTLIMFITVFAFQVPIAGNLLLLVVVTLPYIIANLSVGLFLSTVAKSQVQASQMALFYFLPSMILSGFAFSYRGMPIWAQHFAEIFPLTHYLRILRGIILKGNGLIQVLPEVGAIIIFFIIALTVGVLKYKKTL